MKRLTLIRHAKSSWSDSSLSDFERPLNPRGLRDAPAIGSYLRGSSFPAVDRFLSSPATRARTTAELVIQALGADPDRLRLEPRIYEAPARQLMAILRESDDAETHLVMFGHNPGFEQLARALDAGFEGDGVKFPTCGVAQMDLAIDRWAEITAGCATNGQFICPKRL